ncbi:hypothetical protein ACWDTQ_28190 [Streptomyces cellulosae]
MTAFNANETVTANFTDVDGRALTIRPVFDAGLNRVVTEISIAGTTAKFSHAILPKLTDTLLQAGLLGEIANLSEGNPTPAGA